MRNVLAWTAAILMLVGQPVMAREDASVQDVEQLHAELQNLEAELEAAGERGRIAEEYRQRVERIRENAIYIKVKMQRHQAENREGTGVTMEEVRELKMEIDTLRADLRNLDSDRAQGTLTLPVGTELSIRLQDSLSTAVNRPGDPFTATTVEPVLRRGELVIPAGSIVHGVVEVADRAEGRTDRSSRMILGFNRIEIRDQSYTMKATVVDAGDLETGLGDEKEKLGIGAGVGGILGAVLGGKKGAVIGAVLGGAGAILATEGKDVELDPGTILQLRLDQDLSVATPTT